MQQLIQRLDKLTRDNAALRADVATKTDCEAQARHELKLSQMDVARLQEALEQRSERLEKLRRENDAANAALKDQLAEAQITARDATMSLQHLQASHTQLESRCQELSTSLHHTKEQLTEETAKWTAIVEGHVREKHALTQIQGCMSNENELLEKKVRELEAMIPVMQEELQQAKADCEAALSAAAEACRAAEEEVQRSKTHLDTVMKSTRTSPAELEGGAAPGPSSQALVLAAPTRPSTEPPPGLDLSYTALYEQFERLQQENFHLQRAARKNELDMDHVSIMLERKQVEVQAQNEEFVNLKNSYARTEAQLAAYADEKRALEGRLQQAHAQVRSLEERLQLAELDCMDKARQVASAVEENMRLKGLPQARGNPPFPENLEANAEVDAQSLISQELAAFANMDECLAQNHRLLVALRSVSMESDKNRTMAVQEVEGRLGDELEHQKRLVEQLRQQLATSKETIADLENRARSYVLMLRQQQGENSGAAANALIAPPGQAVSERALQDIKGAFQAECDAMRKDHESMRAMLQDELKQTEEKLLAAMHDSQLSKLQLKAEEERRALLSADYESANLKLAEERKRNAEWQAMAMEAQKRLTAELHTAETERAQIIELRFLVSEANIRREQLEAELERDREQLLSETRLRHTAEGRQQAAEEAARDAAERHRGQLAALEAALQASSDEVVEARRDAAAAKAKLEQVESLLHDPVHAEKLNRVEVALEEAKRRAAELEAQLASAESKLKASDRARKDTEDRNLQLDNELRALQKRLDSASSTVAGAEPSTSDAHVPAASREAELLLQLKNARNELEFWQNDAAATATHLRTYKAIAKEVDEQLDNQRKLLAKEKEAAKEAAAQAEERIQALQEQVNRGKENDAALRVDINQLAAQKHALETQLESVQAEAAQHLKHAQHSASLAEERLRVCEEALARANAEIKSLRDQVDVATMQQADRIKRIQEVSADLEETKRTLGQRDKELADLQLAIEKDNAHHKRDMTKALDDLRQAQAANIELKEQKEELQRQVEQRLMNPSASAGEGSSSSDMATYQHLLSMRANELHKLEQQLQIATIRAERAERTSNEYRATAAEYRARLDAFQKQHADALMSEGEHRARMAGIEEMNLIRSANMGLRTENKQLEEECKALKERAVTAALQESSLSRRVAELESQISTLKQQLEAQTSAAERWRKQASEYINKYGTVDKDAHQEVVQQLERAKQDLARATSQIATLSNRLKESEEKVKEVTAAKAALEADVKAKEAALAAAQDRSQQDEATKLLQARVNSVTKNAETFRKALTHLGYKASDKRPGAFATQLKARLDALEQESKELAALKAAPKPAASDAAGRSLEDAARSAKLSKLQKDLTDTQAKLTAAEVAASEAKAKAATAEETLAKLQSELSAAQSAIAKKDSEISKKDSEILAWDMKYKKSLDFMDKAGKKVSELKAENQRLLTRIAELEEAQGIPLEQRTAALETAPSSEPPAAAPTLKRTAEADAAAPSKRSRVTTAPDAPSPPPATQAAPPPTQAPPTPAEAPPAQPVEAPTETESAPPAAAAAVTAELTAADTSLPPHLQHVVEPESDAAKMETTEVAAAEPLLQPAAGGSREMDADDGDGDEAMKEDDADEAPEEGEEDEVMDGEEEEPVEMEGLEDVNPADVSSGEAAVINVDDDGHTDEDLTYEDVDDQVHDADPQQLATAAADAPAPSKPADADDAVAAIGAAADSKAADDATAGGKAAAAAAEEAHALAGGDGDEDGQSADEGEVGDGDDGAAGASQAAGQPEGGQAEEGEAVPQEGVEAGQAQPPSSETAGEREARRTKPTPIKFEDPKPKKPQSGDGGSAPRTSTAGRATKRGGKRA